MNRTLVSFVAFSAAVMVLMTATPSYAAPDASPAAEKMPWTLREHYTFSGGGLRLDYAKDNAEWRMKLFQEDSETSRMNPDIVLDDVGFTIELKDGRVLTNEMLGQGGETTLLREPYTCPLLGEGTTYTVQFAPKEGLTVQHTLITMRRWSFIRLIIKVSNQGEAPVEITKISPIVIPPGHVRALTENASFTTGKLKFEGAEPVLTGDGPVTSIGVHHPSRNVSLLFGFLPLGLSSCEFKNYADNSPFEGVFQCEYTPGKAIPVGGTIETDPISIGYGLEPKVMDEQYLYLLKKLCAPAPPEGSATETERP